jgi:predicted alpha/beta superfamily hydrolase
MIARLALAAGLALIAALPARAAPFALPDTEVVNFASKDGVQTLRLYVGLPRNYATRNERFAVIVLLDADFSFALAQDVLRHAADRGLEKEAIVVGIAYPGANTDLDIYERTRTRDYTPSHTLEGGYSPAIQALSGGGPAFLGQLEHEVLPMIDAKYRTDPARRMLVGHSFGALFACYAMVTRPGLFHDYLIVSPSLWYDNRMMFALGKTFLAAHKTLPANVFYAAGEEENASNHPMVDDLRAWSDMFAAAKPDGYTSTLTVFSGDTHESVFPSALVRGIRVLDGFAGEAQGNALERK